jgi:hypothetical protein
MASGVRISKDNTKAVLAEADRIMRQKLLLAAEQVRSEAVRSISIPTSTAGPSAPGKPPHADSGKLRQSIMVAPQPDGSVLVGTPLKYGRYLEPSPESMTFGPGLRRRSRLQTRA